jgi:hypothetical protein
MEPFGFHVFVCDQQKPDGVPCCSAKASGKVLDALRREINARGLEDEVQVTTCGSLGLCEHGPNLVVYPEGIWYSGMSESAAHCQVFLSREPCAKLILGIHYYRPERRIWLCGDAT